jgi:hypothetical protein
MFPSPVFRRAYDAIVGQEPNVRGDLEYLRILHLAAATMQCEVEAALECLLEANETPSAEAAKALVKPEDTELPELDEYTVDLNSYDELLGHKEEAS